MARGLRPPASGGHGVSQIENEAYFVKLASLRRAGPEFAFSFGEVAKMEAENTETLVEISWTQDSKRGPVRKAIEIVMAETELGRQRLEARLEKIADKGGYQIEARYQGK